jgi:hypothetical protein
MFERKDKKKPFTLEEIMKAYEDLSDDDKKSFRQSIADRVHESIAAQEKADGNEDSQSAADREHEALGAEHADGEGDVSEIGETDATDEKREEEIESAEEKKDEMEVQEKSDNEKEADNSDDALQALSSRISALEEEIKDFISLKEKMEDYTRRQEEKFGYAERPAGGKKDMRDMSADELKRGILTGEY